MAKFIHNNALYDVWHCHHPTECGYTLFSFVHNTYPCIDYVLVDKWLLQRVSESDIEIITWSDYAPTSTITTQRPLHPTRYGEQTLTL